MTGGEISPPGAHGGDGARLAQALGVPAEAVLDLSASLNPAASDVARLVADHADAVHHYPDPTAAHAVLADAMHVDGGRVLLTNGGAEAIALVAALSPVGWVDPPDFSLYGRHLARIDRGGARWRSNPHNPTGRLAAPGERAGVWDEAFYPLATGRWSRGDPDTIVVGSLTKVFACPGLRVGYVLCPDPATTRRLADRQPEWSVNSLAVAVLPRLLATADLTAWATVIADLRARLDSVLRGAGMYPEPSDANYVLVRRAPGLRDHLARQGILVRDTTSFGIPSGVRVAVPDESGLERLADALGGWAS